MNEDKKSFEDVKEKALRLLEYRSHSEKELSDKLIRYGADEEDIERVIEFCREYNFLNDESYARALAHDLAALKRLGKRRIYSELRVKGISDETAREVLSEMEDDEDELLRLVEKKARGNFERKNREKVIRYFIYRGYELGDIKNALERLMTDEF